MVAYQCKLEPCAQCDCQNSVAVRTSICELDPSAQVRQGAAAIRHTKIFVQESLHVVRQQD